MRCSLGVGVELPDRRSISSCTPFSKDFKLAASGLEIIFSRSSLTTLGVCVDQLIVSHPASPMNLTLEFEVRVPDSVLSFREIRKLEIRPAFLVEKSIEFPMDSNLSIPSMPVLRQENRKGGRFTASSCF